ncbi:hypothetical protein NTD86_21750 [Pseudomonas sp. 7P_10.2_Bac1]|uniref:hypothetical protein n=1 Tax=Pseudomonas sp. 7P_10.2_Bac1 TaxID=2971614 RepID=UPI0021C61196|nr:hypothetical protein [Pseudomonas sp. 7P_10.2_Bac1]MCU1729605.1 hypothetical protein [Pseudomonas sp. 7P_10.2_Bac1]
MKRKKKSNYCSGKFLKYTRGKLQRLEALNDKLLVACIGRNGSRINIIENVVGSFESRMIVRNKGQVKIYAHSSYEAPITYEPGIELVRTSQTITYLKDEYRAKSQFLPFTTTTWEADKLRLNLIGDDSLRQDVGSLTDPQLGAGIVGMDGRLLRDYLKQQEYYLTIEYFGLTDTPLNTRNTMQAAIFFCAENNILLRNKAALYVIDVSEEGIKIPSNFMCDLGGAWIKRATGNITPHDMWSNLNPAEGNFGLNIRGVNFDGQAQTDNLDNRFPEQRFSGLRLIGCEGELKNIRVDNTCNGEIQEEGIRGAILLERSIFIDCQDIRVNNNIGTGLFITGGRGRIQNFLANNNSGSGLSGDQPGWRFDSISSIGSGYSGISLNGPGWIARGIYASGAAAGFAGVNFGHSSPISSNSIGAIASDVVAENNESWGINVTSSPGIQGSNWVVRRCGDSNIRLIDSPDAKLFLVSEDASGNGLLIDGKGHYDIDARISGSKASGIYGRNGASIIVSVGSLIMGNGCNGGFTAEITLDTESEAIVYGRVLNGFAYGVQSSASSVLIVSGGTVKGHALGNIRTALDGIIRYENAKFSDDPTSGTLTILAGTDILQVFNGNLMDPNRIVLTPANMAALRLGVPFIENFDIGVSFTVKLLSIANSDASYRYAIL